MNQTFAKVMKLFGVPVNVTDEEQLLDSSCAISAKSAYMSTKYGTDKDVKQLLSEFFRHANESIKTKTLHNEYCCMLEIDSDLLHYVPMIVSRFKDTLGYNVIIIDNETEIVQGGKSLGKINPNSTFIILMWNTISNEYIALDPVISSVIDTLVPDEMAAGNNIEIEE